VEGGKDIVVPAGSGRHKSDSCKELGGGSLRSKCAY
jgi:hypothetical protein